jgi:hypothetical protein
MNVVTTLRTMDKRLRLALICTALLLIPQVGQFVGIADLNHSGKLGNLALFFAFATIFIVPTVAILSGAIMYSHRADWREHKPIMLLGGLNLLLCLSLAWFFLHPCSWAAAVGSTLGGCK